MVSEVHRVPLLSQAAYSISPIDFLRRLWYTEPSRRIHRPKMSARSSRGEERSKSSGTMYCLTRARQDSSAAHSFVIKTTVGSRSSSRLSLDSFFTFSRTEASSASVFPGK